MPSEWCWYHLLCLSSVWNLVFHIFPPHYFTVRANSVTLWRLHLPNNGGRYATASRNGRVSTCLSAGSCLNWCSIRRAISEVRARSYLWNKAVCRTSTPNLLWHQEKRCVPYPTPWTHMHVFTRVDKANTRTLASAPRCSISSSYEAIVPP